MFRYLFVVMLAAPIVATAADLSVSVSARDGKNSVDIVFTNAEKSEIRKYYVADEVKAKKDKKAEKTPPGLAKKGGLPPGLVKRQRLPESVSYELLPRQLEARLPALPADYIRVRVGDDFAIMNKKTRVVFDMAIGLTL
jgi:hypothetical protein